MRLSAALAFIALPLLFALNSASAERLAISDSVAAQNPNVLDEISNDELETMFSYILEESKSSAKTCTCKCGDQGTGVFLCHNQGPHNDSDKKCDMSFKVTLDAEVTDCGTINKDKKVCYGYTETDKKINRKNVGSFSQCE